VRPWDRESVRPAGDGIKTQRHEGVAESILTDGKQITIEAIALDDARTSDEHGKLHVTRCEPEQSVCTREKGPLTP
jgi:hypothetical protein